MGVIVSRYTRLMHIRDHEKRKRLSLYDKANSQDCNDPEKWRDEVWAGRPPATHPRILQHASFTAVGRAGCMTVDFGSLLDATARSAMGAVAGCRAQPRIVSFCFRPWFPSQ